MNPEDPHQVEPSAVQLTRMEGVLNLIAERGKNTDRRVDAQENEIRAIYIQLDQLRSITQSLTEGAASDKETAIALAHALKDESAARREKSDMSWTPVQRIILLVSGVAALAGIVSLIAS